jgi:hypothetical protein
LSDNRIDFREQFPPRVLHLGRSVGPEIFADRIRDHPEKFAKQFSRGSIGVMRLYLAIDQA